MLALIQCIRLDERERELDNVYLSITSFCLDFLIIFPEAKHILNWLFNTFKKFDL